MDFLTKAHDVVVRMMVVTKKTTNLSQSGEWDVKFSFQNQKMGRPKHKKLKNET